MAQNPSQNCFWQLPSLHVCEVYPASPTMAVLQCSHCRVQQLRQSCMQRSSFEVHLGHHKANRSRRAPMELRLPQQLTHTTAAGFTFTSLHESHALARRHGRQNPFWSSLSPLHNIDRYSDDSSALLHTGRDGIRRNMTYRIDIHGH